MEYRKFSHVTGAVIMLAKHAVWLAVSAIEFAGFVFGALVSAVTLHHGKLFKFMYYFRVLLCRKVRESLARTLKLFTQVMSE